MAVSVAVPAGRATRPHTGRQLVSQPVSQVSQVTKEALEK